MTELRSRTEIEPSFAPFVFSKEFINLDNLRYLKTQGQNPTSGNRVS
jgi:hypothetical protein